MTNPGIGWLIYALGVLPAATLSLWALRRDESVPTAHEGKIAIVFGVFWPGVLAVAIGGFLFGIAVMLADVRCWWALALLLTRPLHQLHLWCCVRFTAAYERKQATERDSVVKET